MAPNVDPDEPASFDPGSVAALLAGAEERRGGPVEADTWDDIRRLIDGERGGTSRPDAVRRRAEARGKLVVPPEPADSPSWKDVLESGHEAGSAVSEALAAERSSEPLA